MRNLKSHQELSNDATAIFGGPFEEVKIERAANTAHGLARFDLFINGVKILSDVKGADLMLFFGGAQAMKLLLIHDGHLSRRVFNDTRPVEIEMEQPAEPQGNVVQLQKAQEAPTAAPEPAPVVQQEAARAEKSPARVEGARKAWETRRRKPTSTATGSAKYAPPGLELRP
jgi:hypothetical protein